MCNNFDPITSNVAPTCSVCGHHGACEKERAALDATNIRDGKAEHIVTRSASIIHKN